MISAAPIEISILFLAIVLSAILMFYRTCRSMPFLMISLSWCAVQTMISLSGFYTNTSSLPPRIVFGIWPPLIFIVVIFLVPAGRRFVDRLNLEALTWFHVIRIPVEITLSILFHVGMISKYQTMEGTNFDLISGITAPIVAWYAFRRMEVRHRLLIFWNVVCLLLLLNVVITSALVAPSRVQQIPFAGEEFAAYYFPFILLPTFVVPLVLFGHFAALRQLVRTGRTSK